VSTIYGSNKKLSFTGSSWYASTNEKSSSSEIVSNFFSLVPVVIESRDEDVDVDVDDDDAVHESVDWEVGAVLLLGFGTCSGCDWSFEWETWGLRGWYRFLRLVCQ